MGYYETGAFPKPKDKKKKLLYNGYKDKRERFCHYCKTPFAERHEIFPGTGNRQISIREKFQIDVCPAHHKELQDNITDWAQKENRNSRRLANINGRRSSLMPTLILRVQEKPGCFSSEGTTYDLPCMWSRLPRR